MPECNPIFTIWSDPRRFFHFALLLKYSAKRRGAAAQDAKKTIDISGDPIYNGTRTNRLLSENIKS